MFKYIDINLRGPICNCEEEHLAWALSMDMSGRFGLEVSCRECGVKLQVPHSQFKARMNLDRKYPKGRSEPKEDAKVLRLVPESAEEDNDEEDGTVV